MTDWLADAGTPLMWFGVLYPFLGSVVVARIEQWLLDRARIARSQPLRWNPILVGNLVTTAFGIVLVNVATPWAPAFLGPRPIETANAYIAIVWAVAFIATLVLESPFFALAVGCRLLSVRTLVATFGANTVTYSVLLLICAVLGRNSINASAKVVPISEIGGRAGAWVYYLPPKGTVVRRIRLDGSRDELTAMSVGSDQDSLSLETDGKTAKLVAYDGKTSVLDGNLGAPGRAALLPFQVDTDGELKPIEDRDTSHDEPGRTFQKPSQDRRSSLDFDTFNMFWPELGLTFRSARPQDSFTIACGTPFLSWTWKANTALPDGRVVAAYGPQIVVVDIPTRRIAWLVNGRSPAVLLDVPVR